MLEKRKSIKEKTNPKNIQITYKMPTKNRNKIITVAFIANADNIAQISAPIAVNRMVFFRPHVSAKKPQKCELITMPRNATDEINPCSVVVIFKSHFAYGKTNAMEIFSMVAPIIASPADIIMRQLNRPVPAINCEIVTGNKIENLY